MAGALDELAEAGLVRPAPARAAAGRLLELGREPMLAGAEQIAGANPDPYYAHSGDCDRPFRPKVITDTGDRDHVPPERAPYYF